MSDATESSLLPNEVNRERLVDWLGLSILLVGLLIGAQQSIDLAMPRWLFVWGYSHAFALFPMVAWLLWTKASEEQFEPSSLGFVGLLISIVGYALTAMIDSMFGMLFMLPILFFSAVWSVGGTKVARIALGPTLLLFLAMPIWDALVPILQIVSAHVVEWLLNLAAVPVLRAGTRLSIPEGDLVIAFACSGMSFLLASLSLAGFYCLAWLNHLRDRFVVVAIALFCAVAANWVRVFGISYAGHLSNMEHYLIVEDHEAFGWIVFALFMVPLFYVCLKLEQRQGSSRVTTTRKQSTSSRGRWIVVGLGFLFALVPLLTTTPDHAPMSAKTDVPLMLPNWSETQTDPQWQPHPDLSKENFQPIHRSFASSSAVVDLVVASFPYHSKGAKMRSAYTWLSDDWEIVERRYNDESSSLKLQKGARTILVRYSYIFGGRRVGEGWHAVLLDIAGRVRLADRPRAIYAFATSCAHDCKNAAQALDRFERLALPAMASAYELTLLESSTNTLFSSLSTR